MLSIHGVEFFARMALTLENIRHAAQSIVFKFAQVRPSLTYIFLI
jgi:hypothetical protein